MKQYSTVIAGLVVAAAVGVAGAAKQAGVIDADTWSTVVAVLIGFVGGGAAGALGRRP